MNRIQSIYLLIFFIGITCVQANEYLCQFNQDNRKKVFRIDLEKEVSKLVDVGSYKILLWKADKNLHLKITGGDFKEPISTFFLLDQKNLEFKYGSNVALICNIKGFKKDINALDPVDSVDKMIVLDGSIKFIIGKNLNFPYIQQREVDMMRSLHFQNGKVFTSSEFLQPNNPWCSFRIQLTRDENTVVPRGDELIPDDFDLSDQNSKYDTFSYSFVDFSAGKIRGARKKYRPFMFICNLRKGDKFNVVEFKNIMGEHMNVEKVK